MTAADAQAEPRPAADTIGQRVARARYSAAQSLRVAWYGAHYAVLKRMEGRSASEDQAQTPIREPRYAMPDLRRTRLAMKRLFEADRANIEAGLYPAPRDLQPGRLLKTLADSRRFFAEVGSVSARRYRRGGTEVRDQADRRRYPTYYLQNFHYQTDGWLSRRSARLYDTQVEVLFSGAADAMRRAALAEVARDIRGRDQRALSLIDVASGSGRFLAQTLDAFPRLNAVALDLSAPYLEEAEDRLAAWPQTRFVEANAEAVPLADASFDVAVTIYLFHELPPRVRPMVAGELARLVKPGGLVVFADSLQYGDDENLDRLLEEFPQIFHEPFYRSYCEEDLDGVFQAHGLVAERQTTAFLTKVRTYRKAG